MKFIKRLFAILGPTLCCSLFLFSMAFAATPFSIGVINDCKATLQNQILEDIKQEVFSLTKGEFDVRFPNEFNRVSDCSEKGIKSNIDRLVSNPAVDMVIALGPLSSHLLSQAKNFPKPCIAGIVLNPELQDIPFKNGQSGKHNFTYVALSPDLKGNIELFKEISGFKKAAFLYDNSLFQSIKSRKVLIDRIREKTDTQIVYLPVGASIQPVLDSLDPDMEAVLCGDLAQLDAKGISDLISFLKKNKIASFSLHDRAMVEKGFLAGFDRTSSKMRFSRRIALLIQRILLNEDPKDFKVGFSNDENLVINMQTAKEIDIFPNFSLMARAELINNAALIKPVPENLGETVQEDLKEVITKQDTKIIEKNSRKEIPLSTFATQETRQFDEETDILNETKESLSFLDAVKKALENNLVLKSKAREIAAGQMNVKEALSKFYPQLGTGMSGMVIDEDRASAILGIAEQSWDIYAQARQIIYSDLTATNLKTNKNYQKALELSENQEKLDIILEAGITYLNMLKTRANARIQFENLKLIRSNLVLANNRYKAGFSGPSDVYRLESEATSAYSDFLKALAQVSESRIHLNQILNNDLEQEITIQDIGLNDDLFIISDPDTRSKLNMNNQKDFLHFRNFVVEKGLEQSPELMAIEEQIKAQTSIYEYTQRAYWSPEVYLEGNIGNTFSKNGNGSSFDPSSLPGSLSPFFSETDDTRWAVSLNVELPLYQGGAKSARKIKSLETRNQLKFMRKDIENRIAENIRFSLFKISSSYPSIELTKSSAVSAGKNLALVLDAYENGAVSIVDLLDAQNASLVANTLAANAVYNFLADYMTSERAAGKYSIFMEQKQREDWLQDFQEFQK